MFEELVVVEGRVYSLVPGGPILQYFSFLLSPLFNWKEGEGGREGPSTTTYIAASHQCRRGYRWNLWSYLKKKEKGRSGQ